MLEQTTAVLLSEGGAEESRDRQSVITQQEMSDGMVQEVQHREVEGGEVEVYLHLRVRGVRGDVGEYG